MSKPIGKSSSVNPSGTNDAKTHGTSSKMGNLRVAPRAREPRLGGTLLEARSSQASLRVRRKAAERGDRPELWQICELGRKPPHEGVIKEQPCHEDDCRIVAAGGEEVTEPRLAPVRLLEAREGGAGHIVACGRQLDANSADARPLQRKLHHNPAGSGAEVIKRVTNIEPNCPKECGSALHRELAIALVAPRVVDHVFLGFRNHMDVGKAGEH
mmetsp:Transcript_7952/g.26046  ORF Transcript_7952/g.26046 Transcript_7952/m.26046 type:complete len:213 (-) Transcript_7952:129-767(-)